MRRLLLCTALVVVNFGCGEAEPPPKAPEPEPVVVQPKPPKAHMSVSSELGQIDPDQLKAAFDKLMPAWKACYEDGQKRVDFLGGDVTFFLRVGSDGTPKWAYLESATLGDRASERCMLDVAMNAHWPSPDGGEAEVHKMIGFDPPSNVRPPADWSPDRVANAVAGKHAEVARCKAGGNGTFHVTAYVEPQGKGGKVATAGVSPPSQDGESKADCLIDVVKKMKMPSPGSYAAKVFFTL